MAIKCNPKYSYKREVEINWRHKREENVTMEAETGAM